MSMWNELGALERFIEIIETQYQIAKHTDETGGGSKAGAAVSDALGECQLAWERIRELRLAPFQDENLRSGRVDEDSIKALIRIWDAVTGDGDAGVRAYLMQPDPRAKASPTQSETGELHYRELVRRLALTLAIVAVHAHWERPSELRDRLVSCIIHGCRDVRGKQTRVRRMNARGARRWNIIERPQDAVGTYHLIHEHITLMERELGLPELRSEFSAMDWDLCQILGVQPTSVVRSTTVPVLRVEGDVGYVDQLCLQLVSGGAGRCVSVQRHHRILQPALDAAEVAWTYARHVVRGALPYLEAERVLPDQEYDLHYYFRPSSQQATITGDSFGVAMALGCVQLLIDEPSDAFCLVSARFKFLPARDEPEKLGEPRYIHTDRVDGIRDKVPAVFDRCSREIAELRRLVVSEENLKEVWIRLHDHRPQPNQVRPISNFGEALVAAAGVRRGLEEYLQSICARLEDRKPEYLLERSLRDVYLPPRVRKITARNPAASESGNSCESSEPTEMGWQELYESGNRPKSNLVQAGFGHGKTLLAWQTAARIAKQSLAELQRQAGPLGTMVIPSTLRIPFILPLDELRQVVSKRSELPAFEPALRKALADHIPTPGYRQAVIDFLFERERDFYLHSSRYHLFLDALDQAGNFDTLAKQIVELEEYEWQVTITSRPPTSAKLLAQCKWFQEWVILPFDREVQAAFVRKWFAHDPEAHHAVLHDFGIRATAQTPRLSSEALRDLLPVPLLLTLLCSTWERSDESVNEHSSIPALIRSSIELLLHESKRSIEAASTTTSEVEVGLDSLALHQKMMIAGAVAFWGMVRSSASGLLKHGGQELVPIPPSVLDEAIYQRTGGTSEGIHREVRVFQSIGLLMQHGNRDYAFSLRVFHEHLAANFLVDALQCSSARRREAAREFISAHRWDPAWEEVLRQIVGLADDPTGVLDLIWEQAPTHPGTSDDLSLSSLVVALSCLDYLDLRGITPAANQPATALRPVQTPEAIRLRQRVHRTIGAFAKLKAPLKNGNTRYGVNEPYLRGESICRQLIKRLSPDMQPDPGQAEVEELPAPAPSEAASTPKVTRLFSDEASNPGQSRVHESPSPPDPEMLVILLGQLENLRKALAGYLGGQPNVTQEEHPDEVLAMHSKFVLQVVASRDADANFQTFLDDLYLHGYRVFTREISKEFRTSCVHNLKHLASVSEEVVTAILFR